MKQEIAATPNETLSGIPAPGIPVSAIPAPEPLAPAVAGRANPRRMIRPTLSWLLVALIVCVNISVWRAGHPQLPAADFEGTISGLAYNAFGRYDSPITKTYPTAAQIEGDLSLLAGNTRRIRTYSSAEFPELPALAERQGLKLTAGVWLDRRTENVTLEISALRKALRDTRSIERVIAGNETLLHNVFTVKELTQQLDALRAQVRVPVSTAEPWHVWLRYPELAKHVDFITVHLLPYWEGVPGAVAMKYAMQRYEEVKKAFPNKHILIGEIGWPSQGDRYDGAYTSPEIQAQFIREFLAHNKGQHIDYFLMEAIDQPWKTANEGRVGAYWGIFHSDRTPKFELLGPVESDPQWFQKSMLATLLALPLMIMFMRRFRHLRWPSKLMMLVTIQAVSSLAVWMVALPFDLYLRWSDWLALCVLAPTLSIMSAILLSQAFEFAEMFWRGNLQRVYAPRAPEPIGTQPFVSIHLACCNEPPEMVIATIASIERLNYANFELLVIDNNTKDEARWQPVRDYMARLDQRFRFFHLPSWPGFKAGALNYALTEVDARAEVIAVVDADYVVNSRWLASLVGYFNDPNVAVVQSPQAHRGWSRQIFHRMMNWEFEGFFRIGMHHRNERDAIIQHGTMTMIRAGALREHGQWSEWCICEDSELGLRMMRAGYSTVYCGEVMGEGLTPNSFEAFKKQRRRWALGAMQIMKGHWRSLFFASELTRAQRYHFVSGWLSWFGDALHLIFALGAMVYTIGIIAAPHLFSLPIMLFMAPLVVFFFCKAMFGPLLYLRRVPGTLGDAIGAAIAGMALSHGIALGVLSGLTQKKGVFEITGKGKVTASASGWLNKLNQYQAVREEAFLLLGLLSCILGIAISRKGNHVESALWMTVLALQAIPYMATLLCSWLSRLPDTPTSEVRAPARDLEGQEVSLLASPVQIANAQ